MSALNIKLISEGSSEDDIAAGSNVFRTALIEKAPSLKIETATAETKPNAKGDPITIGTIVVTAFTSGAVAALIGAIKAIFARDKKLKVEIHRAGGQIVKIDAENVDRQTVRQALEHL